MTRSILPVAYGLAFGALLGLIGPEPLPLLCVVPVLIHFVYAEPRPLRGVRFALASHVWRLP